MMKKYLFISCGTLSLIIGLCGLITPGLPTTPFILLSGTLYAKSSPRLYRKLEQNRLTGMYLKRMETGLSLKARIISISIMWCMVLISAFLIFDKDSKMSYVMLLLGVIGTIAQIIVLRKKKSKTLVEHSLVKSEVKDMSDIINTESDISN